jgi:hypothetical protein
MNAPGTSEHSRIVASKDQVSCDLAGEAAILSLRTGVYYGLNPVGARIWNLIQTTTTFGQLRDTLLGTYDVEPATLESDMRDLLTELAEHGLIEIST